MRGSAFVPVLRSAVVLQPEDTVETAARSAANVRFGSGLAVTVGMWTRVRFATGGTIELGRGGVRVVVPAAAHAVVATPITAVTLGGGTYYVRSAADGTQVTCAPCGENRSTPVRGSELRASAGAGYGIVWDPRRGAWAAVVVHDRGAADPAVAEFSTIP